MIRPFAAFLLALPLAAAMTGTSAYAQYYAPQPYYRDAGPPDADMNRLPPPGYYADDDQDLPPMRRPRMSQTQQQGQPGGPQNVLPDDRADALPPPGFASPDGRPYYGHQLDAAPQAAGIDANAPRPPAAVGNAPQGLQQAPPQGMRQGTQQGTQQGAPQAAPSAPVGTAILPPEDQPEVGQPKELPDNLRRQLVDYSTQEPAGTIIVDTAHTYLYLVLGKGKALRYGVRVGRDGFTWTGTERISKMKEWPDWFPPPEMIERQPYLPRMMAGGPGNPLGARAMYLGNTLYRIHGTNQPSTIGHYVSSGCVGMLNEDVEDLYSRVQVGSRVVVLPGKAPETAANGGSGASATSASVMAEPANPMAPPPR